MYDEVIELGKVTFTKNKYAQEDETTEWREVFAEVNSVSRSEFYSASMANIRPSIVFVLADYYDYDDERMIRYHGKTYDVIRTYRSKDGTELEITAEMREKDGNRS